MNLVWTCPWPAFHRTETRRGKEWLALPVHEKAVWPWGPVILWVLIAASHVWTPLCWRKKKLAFPCFPLSISTGHSSEPQGKSRTDSTELSWEGILVICSWNAKTKKKKVPCLEAPPVLLKSPLTFLECWISLLWKSETFWEILVFSRIIYSDSSAPDKK